MTIPLESVKKVADADFPTRWGHFRILGFEGTRVDPEPCSPGTAAVSRKTEGAIALVLGDIHSGPPVVRRSANNNRWNVSALAVTAETAAATPSLISSETRTTLGSFTLLLYASLPLCRVLRWTRSWGRGSN